MDSTQPSVQVKLKALKDANGVFARATTREQAARKAWELRVEQLREARRGLKRLLEALQPELPELGALGVGDDEPK